MRSIPTLLLDPKPQPRRPRSWVIEPGAVPRQWDALDRIMVKHGMDPASSPEESQAWLEGRLRGYTQDTVVACVLCALAGFLVSLLSQ